jgi:Lrp/AsnC family transcriptional regulator for asnA, asnC and gidA
VSGGFVDKLDRLIFQTLQEGGRTPFTHIARQAGVSETTIRSRYRHLVEAGTVRTVGLVEPHALGFQAPAIITSTTCSRTRYTRCLAFVLQRH